MSKLILVAMATICGAALAKGKVEPFEVAAGDHLTDKVVAKLGLDADSLTDLIAKGTVVEVDATITAAEPAGADQSAELAAANKRADDAEAKLKDLEGTAAAETKRADDAEAKVKDLEGTVAVEAKRADDADAAVVGLHKQLAAETTRADGAEVQVKELVAQLEEATKPAAKPAGAAG